MVLAKPRADDGVHNVRLDVVSLIDANHVASHAADVRGPLGGDPLNPAATGEGDAPLRAVDGCAEVAPHAVKLINHQLGVDLLGLLKRRHDEHDANAGVRRAWPRAAIPLGYEQVPTQPKKVRLANAAAPRGAHDVASRELATSARLRPVEGQLNCRRHRAHRLP